MNQAIDLSKNNEILAAATRSFLHLPQKIALSHP
jgi:hypothetical protein